MTKGLKNKISNFDNVQNLEFSFFQPSNKLHQEPQINYINNIFHFKKIGKIYYQLKRIIRVFRL